MNDETKDATEKLMKHLEGEQPAAQSKGEPPKENTDKTPPKTQGKENPPSGPKKKTAAKQTSTVPPDTSPGKPKPATKKKAPAKKAPAKKAPAKKREPIVVRGGRRYKLGEVIHVPWTDIVEVKEYDVRVADGNLDALCKQIESAERVHTPLRCVLATHSESGSAYSKPQLHLYKGYRRKRALRILSKRRKSLPSDMFDKVPVVVDRAVTDENRHLVLATKLQLQSKPFNPVEVGIMLTRIMEQGGLTTVDVSRIVHMRVGDVSARMALVNASQKLTGALARGDIPVAEAAEVVRTSATKKEQDENLAALQENGAAAKEPKPLKRVRLKKPQERGRPPLNPAQRSALLQQVSEAWSAFVRSDSPAKESNETWVAYCELMTKVRNLNLEKRL